MALRPIQRCPSNHGTLASQGLAPARRRLSLNLYNLNGIKQQLIFNTATPQPENYSGCVNAIGIRSCYDECKRIAETLCFDYRRMHGVQIRVARNFIVQALKGEPLTCEPLPVDDPMQRQPVIALEQGMETTIAYFRESLAGATLKASKGSSQDDIC